MLSIRVQEQMLLLLAKRSCGAEESAGKGDPYVGGVTIPDYMCVCKCVLVCML